MGKIQILGLSPVATVSAGLFDTLDEID